MVSEVNPGLFKSILDELIVTLTTDPKKTGWHLHKEERPVTASQLAEAHTLSAY